MRSSLPTLLVGTLLAATLAACGKSDRELRADSLAAATTARARQDSLDAARLTVVDTAIAPELRTRLGIDFATMTHTPSGLYLRDVDGGRGPAADSTSDVLVHYTTWLANGTVVDKTVMPGGVPRAMGLGRKRLLLAWEEGLRGMRAGGRRLLVAPPSLAYGIAGKPGSVPELATLVFDIRVVTVMPMR
jgi:FKBP-type peptidyl-prolyl cis-trans isomerase